MGIPTAIQGQTEKDRHRRGTSVNLQQREYLQTGQPSRSVRLADVLHWPSRGRFVEIKPPSIAGRQTSGSKNEHPLLVYS
jgi:hypothetical protein